MRDLHWDEVLQRMMRQEDLTVPPLQPRHPPPTPPPKTDLPSSPAQRLNRSRSQPALVSTTTSANPRNNSDTTRKYKYTLLPQPARHQRPTFRNPFEETITGSPPLTREDTPNASPKTSLTNLHRKEDDSIRPRNIPPPFKTRTEGQSGSARADDTTGDRTTKYTVTPTDIVSYYDNRRISASSRYTEATVDTRILDSEDKKAIGDISDDSWSQWRRNSIDTVGPLRANLDVSNKHTFLDEDPAETGAIYSGRRATAGSSRKTPKEAGTTRPKRSSETRELTDFIRSLSDSTIPSSSEVRTGRAEHVSLSSAYVPLSVSAELLEEETDLEDMAHHASRRDTSLTAIVRDGRDTASVTIKVNVYYVCMWCERIDEGMPKVDEVRSKLSMESLTPKYCKFITFVSCGRCVQKYSLDHEEVTKRSDIEQRKSSEIVDKSINKSGNVFYDEKGRAPVEVVYYPPRASMSNCRDDARKYTLIKTWKN